MHARLPALAALVSCRSAAALLESARVSSRPKAAECRAMASGSQLPTTTRCPHPAQMHTAVRSYTLHPIWQVRHMGVLR